MMSKTLEVVIKPGFSNTKLNPSPNSGLETDLQINPSAINYWVPSYSKRQLHFNPYLTNYFVLTIIFLFSIIH